jgi:zinc transporter, ZIP family
MVAVYALSAFVMTLAGGAFALYYRKYLLFIMAFSAGVLVGVVFLDLFPEIIQAAARDGIPIPNLMTTVLAGFGAIFLLEKLTVIHGEKQHDAPGHSHNVGLIGAIGLSFHSFLDGVAIGVGFQTSAAVGVIVLLAVTAHDFADGLNTVTFMLATRNSLWRTVSLLLVDAVAPVAGALSTTALDIPSRMLAYQLSFFAGFLLYLGAADLLPQSHEKTRTVLIACTIGGVITAGILVRLISAVA